MLATILTSRFVDFRFRITVPNSVSPCTDKRSRGNGYTNISKTKAYNVQDLPQPSGDLSHATLYMFTSHSADITEKAHGEGVHEQGDLSGSKEAIAYTFTREFGFYQGIGTSESVNYHS